MGALVAAHMPGVLDLVSSRSLGLRELMGAKAPLEKMVGSTCLILLQSAGDAGDAVFLFYLERVILGEMIGVLLF